MIQAPNFKVDYVRSPKPKDGSTHKKIPLSQHKRVSELRDLSVVGIKVLNAILDTKSFEMIPRKKIQVALDILENPDKHIIRIV
jgi:hypothetical protein